jgi:hypothetical protein
MDIVDLEKEVAAASAELAAAEQEVFRLSEVGKKLDRIYAATVKVFVQDNLVTPTDAAKAYAAASAAERLAIARGDIEAPVTATPHFRSPIDAHNWYSRHRGDANDAIRQNMKLGHKRGWVDPRTGQVHRPLPPSAYGQNIYK